MIITKTIATINLDNDEGVGKIFSTYQGSSYYENIDLHRAWIINVEMPNGEILDAGIAPQKSIDDVINAISSTWGAGTWNLNWEE